MLDRCSLMEASFLISTLIVARTPEMDLCEN